MSGHANPKNTAWYLLLNSNAILYYFLSIPRRIACTTIKFI